LRFARSAAMLVLVAKHAVSCWGTCSGTQRQSSYKFLRCC
jgi:hypothetical protein